MSEEDDKEKAKKAWAAEQAREVANSLVDVLGLKTELDSFVSGKPRIVADRCNSIKHIMSVFGSEEVHLKRELAYYLYYPHFYAIA